MNCPDCKAEMKPLFTGFYCPNDCDKPELKAKALDKKVIVAQKATATPNLWNTVNRTNVWGGTFPTFPLPTTTYIPAQGQCRDAMCRGQGKLAYQTYAGSTPQSYTYQCTVCSKQHTEAANVANSTPQPVDFINLWN